jgi:hypothetical protein
MRKKYGYAAIMAAAGMAAFLTAAVAADIPVKASPKAVAQESSSGLYLWIDGFYERVNLPAFGLGFHNTGPGPARSDLGPTQTFDPHLDGGGVRGAFGYRIPGTATRVEIGGSYIDANAKETKIATTGPIATGILMTGFATQFDIFSNCAGIFTCITAGTLATDYRAWQLNGAVKTDWTVGSVTITPSLMLFGGSSRAAQTLGQTFTTLQNNTTVVISGGYTANTRLKWRDLGARAGLHLSSQVTPSFIVGWGGSVGVAARRVSFSGADFLFSDVPGFDAASALTLRDNKAALLANAEVDLNWRLTPATTLRAFAGLNSDSNVPGIGVPSYSGDVLAQTGSTSAGLIYSRETNVYAGGGLIVNFTP